jgi:hypothetical protein
MVVNLTFSEILRLKAMLSTFLFKKIQELFSTGSVTDKGLQWVLIKKGDKNEDAITLIFIAWFDTSRHCGLFCSGDHPRSGGGYFASGN